MKTKFFILLCIFNLQVFSQTVLGVDTILKNGPLDKRINLVIISDGFTTSEMSLFLNKASALSNYLLSSAPYKNYKKYFNVFAIKCPSPQSGVSHPGTATDVVEPQIPVVSIQNNFNTRFDNGGVHRSIYSANSAAIYAVLAANFPNYDQAVILGNSTEYGGTGGPYAVMSINGSAPETLVHEMGHSFAGLADEYWAGPQFTAEKPNMTANSNTATVKWAQWLGFNGVDVYPYDNVAPGNNWYKPHENCKMQYLGSPYCPVCQQSVVERIHSLTNPVDAYSPADSSLTLVDTMVWFKTALVKPTPNTLKSTWQINSTLVAGNADSIHVSYANLSQGYNNIIYTVIDTTVMSRDANHPNLHTYSVMWDVTYYSTVGIKDIKPRMAFSMFPNPATDVINLNYTLLKNSDVGITVTDMSGKAVITEKSRPTAAGEYKKEINISSLTEGNYILVLRINDQIINNKFIVFK